MLEIALAHPSDYPMSPSLPPADSGHAKDANRAYYDRRTQGQEDYWRLMAAPRFRVRMALRAVAQARPATICDFGCGNGALLGAVHARFPHIQLMGLDLSSELIAENSKRLPYASFAAADLCGETFAFPWEPVDMALSMEVIEHLDQPGLYLNSIYRALAPGGTLFLSTQSGPIRATEQHVGHVRHWSREDIHEALAQAGFSDISPRSTGWPFHDLSKYLANRNPDKTIRSFGESGYGFKQKAVCLALRCLFLCNSRRCGLQLFAVARKPLPGEDGQA